MTAHHKDCMCPSCYGIGFARADVLLTSTLTDKRQWWRVNTNGVEWWTCDEPGEMERVVESRWAVGARLEQPGFEGLSDWELYDNETDAATGLAAMLEQIAVDDDDVEAVHDASWLRRRLARRCVVCLRLNRCGPGESVCQTCKGKEVSA